MNTIMGILNLFWVFNQKLNLWSHSKVGEKFYCPELLDIPYQKQGIINYVITELLGHEEIILNEPFNHHRGKKIELQD